VRRLIDHAYRDGSQRALMIKTLFLTGARLSEFVHIRVEDLHPHAEPPRTHLADAKGQANRSVPILPALADDGPMPCPDGGDHPRSSSPSAASLDRHDPARFRPGADRPVAQVPRAPAPLDHQVYSETSLRAPGEGYVRALSGPN
jgi:integrase